jgi:hypothetical protein
MDVDGTGVADGDHLADAGVPGDRGGRRTERRVVFGLADQASHLPPEGAVLGGEWGQDLGQAPTALASCGRM